MSGKSKSISTLAIIPARGGSKRLPGKNIKELAGKPLIVYTIEAAKGSKYITNALVSTDDKDIASVAEKHDCKVHMRPNHLGRNETPTIDVIIDVLDNLEKNEVLPDIVILLQPTSPLRTCEDIDTSILNFKNGHLNDEALSLISVCEFDESPYWSFELKGDYLEPIFGEEYFCKRSQDLPKAYRPNGAIYISTPDVIKERKTFYTDRTIPYIMPKERSIDIDTEFDFKLAELIMDDMNER